MKKMALIITILILVSGGCTGKEVASGIMGMPCEFLFDGAGSICSGAAHALLDFADEATTHYDRYDLSAVTNPKVELYACTDNWCQHITEPPRNIEYYTCSDNWCRSAVGSIAIDTSEQKIDISA